MKGAIMAVLVFAHREFSGALPSTGTGHGPARLPVCAPDDRDSRRWSFFLFGEFQESAKATTHKSDSTCKNKFKKEDGGEETKKKGLSVRAFALLLCLHTNFRDALGAVGNRQVRQNVAQ